MNIELIDIGKRFGKEWIFREVNLNLSEGSRLAITGSNGAGKSTLLKIIGTYLTPSRGEVKIEETAQHSQEDLQIAFNYAAPYGNLLEEYTLNELIKFHKKFKQPFLNIDELIQTSGLEKARNKFVSDFSSGMKQRVKLILTFGFDSQVILLDEPTTNLDRSGIEWFKEIFYNYTQYKNKTIVIASNITEEIDLCSNEFHIN